MSEKQFPNDENGEALAHMAEQGVDLGAIHQVDFEFAFPDEASARKFAAAVKASVTETSVRVPDADEDEDEDEWEVQCRQRMVPSHEAITATEQRLEEQATLCGGFSDGWGLMSRPDGSPAD